jgi:HD superfamily phosphohydrolase
MANVKYLNDNVHGRIELTPIEQDICNSPTFLRLGRIQQLGLGSMVFPSASHTRLVHSLGVLHVMAETLKRIGIGGEEAEKLRLAALLHDIGQYPLSHAIEFVYRKIGAPTKDQDLYEESAALTEVPDAFPSTLQNMTFRSSGNLGDDAKDKKMAGYVIRRRPDLERIFRERGKNEDFIDEVARIIAGTSGEALYLQLLDSDYDCDRLDFVARDAFLTGVNYGHIDLEYFIENLAIRNDPADSTHRMSRVLAINRRRAMHTLEHYLTARYYMYSQVVYHCTIKSLELIAKALFWELARKGVVYENYRGIQEIIPSPDFLFFDDTYFWRAVRECVSAPTGQDDYVRELCARLINKRPLKLVKEYRKIWDRIEESGDGEYNRLSALLFNKRQFAEFCRYVGVDLSDLVVEEIPVGVVPIGPDLKLSSLIKGGWQRVTDDLRRAPRLYNEEDNSPLRLIIEEPGSIVEQMSRTELRIIRIFLTDDDDQKAARLREEINEWTKSGA